MEIDEKQKQTQTQKQKQKQTQKQTQKNKTQIDYKTLLPFLNVSDSVKRDILEYVKMFKEYILCKTSHRQSCQYVLDKLIIYEKYKDEVF